MLVARQAFAASRANAGLSGGSSRPSAPAAEPGLGLVAGAGAPDVRAPSQEGQELSGAGGGSSRPSAPAAESGLGVVAGAGAPDVRAPSQEVQELSGAGGGSSRPSAPAAESGRGVVAGAGAPDVLAPSQEVQELLDAAGPCTSPMCWAEVGVPKGVWWPAVVLREATWRFAALREVPKDKWIQLDSREGECVRVHPLRDCVPLTLSTHPRLCLCLWLWIVGRQRCTCDS